jgi:glucose-6-phosphate isomerase
LRPAAWNELDDEAREFFPRITALENVDPVSVAAALRRIDPRRVFVNVISKSGGTAETLAQYLVVRGWLDEALGQDAAVRHIAFTTDPTHGPLRAIAEREGIAALEIRRASSPRKSDAGRAAPAALTGIDVAGLVTAPTTLEQQNGRAAGEPTPPSTRRRWAADSG